MTKAVVF